MICQREKHKMSKWELILSTKSLFETLVANQKLNEVSDLKKYKVKKKNRAINHQVSRIISYLVLELF